MNEINFLERIIKINALNTIHQPGTTKDIRDIFVGMIIKTVHCKREKVQWGKRSNCNSIRQKYIE